MVIKGILDVVTMYLQNPYQKKFVLTRKDVEVLIKEASLIASHIPEPGQQEKKEEVEHVGSE